MYEQCREIHEQYVNNIFFFCIINLCDVIIHAIKKKKKRKYKNVNVGLETYAKTQQKGVSLVNSQVSPPEHAVKIKILI